MLREAINTESLEVNKRVDKVNIDRMNDVADVQAKVFTSITFVPTLGLGGKSQGTVLGLIKSVPCQYLILELFGVALRYVHFSFDLAF